MPAMSRVLTELIELLRLERIEDNLFRGPSQDLGWGQVFGGQVLGQALSAAAQTVPAERPVHSLHAYFLRPGRVDRPVVYNVDPIRDGTSFTTRRVVAVQAGRAIFTLAASFQVDESGFEHQDEMPSTPPPDGLANQEELAAKEFSFLPAELQAKATAERPIEIRPVESVHPIRPEKLPPRRHAWFRARGRLPDEDAVHRALLAYASDFHLLTTSLQPHGVTWLTPGMQVASIDHAMWFHRRFRLDDWLLYAVDSPSASGARGLVRGRFFDREGHLVASTAQEGLIRLRGR
jgi:acyl-CoA thioesterase-2